MRLVIRRLSMSAKFVLIGASFSLPIALLLYLYISQVQARIEFTDRELRGTAYLRPLVELQAILREAPSAETEARAAAAWSALERVQEQHGTTLQFTPVGLAKRGRRGLEPQAMRERWEKVRREPVDVELQKLDADFGRMITHAGDLSNLILDPDLDTYYLMDVTLLALPQLQARLNRISEQAKMPEPLRMSLESGLLKEVDLPRVRASTTTAWLEDPNFVGIRPTLKPRLTVALAAFEKRHNELIHALESADADSKHLTELGTQARHAGVEFWKIATGELDGLLWMRVEALREERNRALAISLLSLAGASWLAVFLLRSITQPLEQVVRELSPESVAMRVSAERLSLRRLRDALSEEESAVLSAEMNQHSMTIRRAVIELVAQISGGAGELAARVEGARWSTPRK